MSDLPLGWSLATIADLASSESRAITDGPFGSALKREHYTPTGPRVIRLGNIGVGVFLDKDRAHISRERFETLSAHKAVAGDVLVAALGDPLGRACVVPEGIGLAIVKADCFRIRPWDEIDPRFLSYWLNAPQSRSQFAGNSHGLGRVRINLANLRQHEVPLPPLAEQRRVVAKLDQMMARTVRARAELAPIPSLIELHRQALLRAAFNGLLTEEWRAGRNLESAAEMVGKTSEPVQPRGGREATDSVIRGQGALSVSHPETEPPKGWDWTPLLRVARQETGHTPSRSRDEYWNGGIPWIGIRDAGAFHGRTITETIQTISQAGLENSSARLLPTGTVCLSRTASVGYVTILGREMATSQDFATWTCTEALEPKFLMYALLAEGDDIRAFGKGSTHTTIYFPEIRALHICLAPLEEQREIVRRIESAFAWLDKVAHEHAQATRLLDHLDQALLAKAFRGELVPQDPADEPAAKLLARIRAEREGVAPAVRRRKARG